MLIHSPYPNPVSDICPIGQLAIPDLEWVVVSPPLVLQKISSFRGMFTCLKNRGFNAILEHYFPQVELAINLEQNHINTLEVALMNDINSVIINEPPYEQNPLLQCIAVGIQLWGGITGRNAFVKNGGFQNNFSMQVYAHLIELLMTHPAGVPLPYGNWQAVMDSFDQFHHIGVSFMTKHLSFWSRADDCSIQLPILDRIVKAKFINPNSDNPVWNDYVRYVVALNEEKAALTARQNLAEITIYGMERQLFNWANLPNLLDWHR